MTKRILPTLIVLSLFSTEAEADRLVLTHGDRITGAIVRLEDGRIEIQSELLGSISADWDSISDIQSNNRMYVTLADECLIVGALSSGADTLEVRTDDETVAVDRESVVSIRSEPDYERLRVESQRLDNPRFTDFWSAAIDAAVSSTQGNADTRALNVGIRAARTTEDNQFSGYFTTLFADNSTTGESVTTASAIRGGTRYELSLSGRFFTFGFTDVEFDRFQDLDLRLVLGGGFGVDLMETPRASLELFAGASSNQEFFKTGLDRKSAESVFGEDLTYQLTRLTSLTQRLSVFPNMSNFGEFRLTLDTTAVTRLNDWLSWQVTLSDRYLSNPVPGKKQNDLLFTTGIRITTGGGSLGNIGSGTITIN